MKYLLDLSFVEKNKSKNNFKKKDFPDVQQFMDKLFYFDYMISINGMLKIILYNYYYCYVII